MKYKVLIPIALVAFVGLSWFSLFKGAFTKANTYNDLIEQADESYEKELYQQAYGLYEDALSINPSKEIENKRLDAYKAFAEEQETSDTYSAYLKALSEACETFPEEETYWEEAIRANLVGEKYENAMELCKEAEQEKVKSDEISALKQQVLYSYKLGGYACSAYQNAVNGYFITQTGTRYARLSSDAEDYDVLDEVEVGCVGEDGIYLSKSEENKIQFVDLDGIIRGKVDLELSEFGTYMEGFCSAKHQGKYCFIDLDGKILIDNLQYAGCFQDGKAVIQNAEGRWAFIDTKGKICSDYYEEIKVDYIGRYLFDENIIVKEDGKYKLYNNTLKKELKELQASEIDIPVVDGLVAFCENGKWGFMNSEGKTEIPPQYEQAKSFAKGFAGVCKDGKWGLINQDNELIVEYQFYDVGYVSEDGVCYVSDAVDYYQVMNFNFPKEIMK